MSAKRSNCKGYHVSPHTPLRLCSVSACCAVSSAAVAVAASVAGRVILSSIQSIVRCSTLHHCRHSGIKAIGLHFWRIVHVRACAHVSMRLCRCALVSTRLCQCVGVTSHPFVVWGERSAEFVLVRAGTVAIAQQVIQQASLRELGVAGQSSTERGRSGWQRARACTSFLQKARESVHVIFTNN